LSGDVSVKIVTNRYIPRGRPRAEALIQHDGRPAPIFEIDGEIATVGHIPLKYRNAHVPLFPELFDYRFLVDCFSPIMPDLPWLASLRVGSRRPGFAPTDLIGRVRVKR